MKFALLSVTYSGLFYSGKALSIEQQVRKAKQLGFEALAIETKRPIASPLDLSKADRARIKAVAADEGIALCAIESMSNFCSRNMEERENNLAMMRFVLELASDLGITMVKIFAAWPGIIDDEEALAMYAPYDRGNYFKPLNAADLRVWSRAVEGIREVAALAADRGITLLLQNHAPVLNPGYEDTLAMMQEIDRKNVKLCIDVPLFSGANAPNMFVKPLKNAVSTSCIRTTVPGTLARQKMAGSFRIPLQPMAERSIMKHSSRLSISMVIPVTWCRNIACLLSETIKLQA